MPSRRKLLKIGLALGAASLGLYTWRIEPHWLEIVRRPPPIAGLPKTLVGKRLLLYIIMKLALMAVLALWVLLPLFFKLESYSF